MRGQNVKIVGSDPGISAELNGGTHMSMEDIGVLRSIPSMVIFEPVDGIQLKKAMPQILEHDGPVYLRLFRKNAPRIVPEDYEFNLFKADVLKDGNAVTIAATGIMVEEALKAHAGLKEMDIEAEIINVHTIKPLDSATILESVQKNGLHRYRRKPQRYRWFAQRGSGNNFGKFPGSPSKVWGGSGCFRRGRKVGRT